MTSVVEHEQKPSGHDEVKPVWPRDLPLTALTDGVDAPYETLRGDIEPGGQLTLTFADEEFLIGVQDSATTLRLIPTLGPTPLLVFTRPRLRCAPGRSLNVEIDVPLHFSLGVGGPHTPFTTVHEITPPGSRRSLYGPVDSGTICRSVYTHAATALGLREPDDLTARLNLSVVNAASTTLEVSKVMLPIDALSLWQHRTTGIYAGTVHMKLLSVREAELRFSQDRPGECEPLLGMNGERVNDSRPPLLFTYAYKNKTGLEYGF